jgi:PAS domain S-box-containing protein
MPVDEEFSQRVVQHLVDIGNGKCAIDDAAIAAEPSAQRQEILTGLLFLHEELELQRQRQSSASEALRESEARFRALSDSGLVGIMIGGDDGTIVESNDAFLKMVGYSREDLLARRLRWGDLSAPEYRHSYVAAGEQLDARGVASAWEQEYLRKDGSRVPVIVGVARFKPGSAIAVCVDVTRKKSAEDALRRNKDDLERLVVDRTDALRKSEEQLFHAQKTEAVGRLAGGVAHDFNNLLSVILSYGSLMIGDLRPEDPMRADLEEIVRAGNRAAELTRQLLAFSRQQVMKAEILDLNLVVGKLEKMLVRLLGADVELVFTSASGLGRVRADASQIEQILMNLAVNARDAMPRGGTLTIETENASLDEAYAAEHVGVEPGEYVMLAVSDNGVGMDRATLARVFEPFFTTKEKGKGTGLGLATVFGIVRQSGGHIYVYSELASGTTFKIYLPRVQATASQAVPPSPLPPPSSRGSETILLLEDDQHVRTVVSGILRRNGYHVVEAHNAGDALLICEQHKTAIHLLLSDVVLPRASGPEIAQRLRPMRPEMRVLFMSGYTGEAIVNHGLLDSDVPFLPKPITPDSLTRKVRDVLDAGRKR